jgi:molybdopterin-guanine dinucleotide biosynthesis protein A
MLDRATDSGCPRSLAIGDRGSMKSESPSISAFVLAGGKSSRMGQDKALLMLAGQPLIVHALSVLRTAGLSPAIAGARSGLSQFAEVISDPSPDLGPLAGICAALESTEANFSVFLPVDLPLLTPELIVYLVHRAQVTGAAVTIPAICGAANTFPAVLDKAVLPALKAELETGRRGCLAAFYAAAQTIRQTVSLVPVEYVAQSGQAVHPRGIPAALWFLNVNTPADLDLVERYFGSQIA